MGIIGVGVVLTDPQGRILLGERIKAGEEPSWCLPGGAVEPGETFEAAAVRELEEETGIGDAGPPRVTAVIVDHPGGVVRVTAAVIMDSAQVVPHLEGSGRARVTEPEVFRSWRWFAPDELPAPLFPATAQVLEAAPATRYRVVS
ncbi:NUDIX domain-containing protein [Nonomuraea glycinis]|uniref:ADP-ribose pyrophosphatase n=1 Tax=Nonomuraea glycinis TaxID=2047744 RepID=A0A918E414_9ACTN|nr:NUDIX domain-containing protein [Nonomuraea glycinis]MCA2175698.1 NUDIX domain-containing protein [Nonomuraea glycinis]GGP05206.1 ADP-ribose pyrophosphatase [Nonomuraea glycinis]